MKLFRAIPRRNFDPNFVGGRRSTQRIPSNVPFVVDNLWEYLRPGDLPSRRRAIYASPTRELALAGASGDGPLKDGYLVCELEFFPESSNSISAEKTLYRAAQLTVPDAREHPDVFLLKKLALAKLGAEFADLPLAEKLGAAALFLPGASPEDLMQASQANPAVRGILNAARELSTFWTEAGESSAGTGEVFFELLPGAAYRLKPLDSA
jgi:hypothetical protein